MKVLVIIFLIISIYTIGALLTSKICFSFKNFFLRFVVDDEDGFDKIVFLWPFYWLVLTIVLPFCLIRLGMESANKKYEIKNSEKSSDIKSEIDCKI